MGITEKVCHDNNKVTFTKTWLCAFVMHRLFDD